VRFGDGDRRAKVDPFVELFAEDLLRDRAPWIQGDDLFGVEPARMRPDFSGRRRVGEVGAMLLLERACCDRERAIDGVAAAVGADRVAVRGVGDGRDDRPALTRRLRTPMDR
jgi:hypothetical protein